MRKTQQQELHNLYTVFAIYYDVLITTFHNVPHIYQYDLNSDIICIQRLTEYISKQYLARIMCSS